METIHVINVQIHLIQNRSSPLFGSYYLAWYHLYGGTIKQIMTNPSGDRDTI